MGNGSPDLLNEDGWLPLSVTLHPKVGPVAGAEMGLRSSRWSFSGTLEWMYWPQSDMEPPLQPPSSMLTAGLKIALSF